MSSCSEFNSYALPYKLGLRKLAVFSPTLLIAAALLLGVCGETLYADADPAGESYMLTDHWGGTWEDVEKSAVNSDDDKLCWAAAAANVLKWGGWTNTSGTYSADGTFDYYVDHWSNQGSLMDNAWRWWIDGYNPYQGFSGWAQVDTPGGGFYEELNYNDYYLGSSNGAMALSNIYNYLTDGAGVTMAIYKPQSTGGLSGHAVTIWGVNYDFSLSSPFLGLWITDSDDSKYDLEPADRLRYYEVAYSSVDYKWHLQDFYSTDSWYIGAVQGLKPIPEPASISFALLSGMILWRKSRRNKVL